LCVVAPVRAGLTDWLGGNFRDGPLDALTPAASALVARAYTDLGDAPLVDYHAHLVGTGAGGTGAAINSAKTSWWHPIEQIKARVFLSASGVEKEDHFDADYLTRFVQLARGFPQPIKIHLLALDHNYNSDGTINKEHTDFYIPNARVVAVARQYPDLFVPVISVHPNRPDALAELDRWTAQGVRHIKWLPNAQNIDPAEPRHDAFYRKLREHHMVLLAHTGREGAVDAAGAQELGNPLRLRRALDAGVTVIMAHCASRGQSADLEHPGAQADNFDLFLRMMDDPRYRGRLFADISAMAQWNRLPKPLLEILRRPNLQARLVNGSDYPMPAINCTISLRTLARLGVLDDADRAPLKEIYQRNPLLFDFVLKRVVHEPKTGARLAREIFLAKPQLAGQPAAVTTTNTLPERGWDRT
jgi:predicted TIM-barrel fold metal-dependent hydrolase